MSRPTKRKSRTTNPIAKLLPTFIHKRFKDLSDRRYRQRVVKDKSKYSRKDKHGQTDRHYEHSDSSETST